MSSSAAAELYGYEDCSPATAAASSAAPASSNYDYEDCAPTPRTTRSSTTSPGTHGGAHGGTRARRGGERRSSMPSSSASTTAHCSPTTKTPRRSSMKQTSSYNENGVCTTSTSKPQRRASIQFTGEVEVSLPNTNKVVKRRTSISFDTEVTVRTMRPMKDMVKCSETDPNAALQQLWFQPNEYSALKERAYQLVDMVESNNPNQIPLGKKPCIRGLEGMMTQNSKNKQHRRNCAYDIVFDEQDYQQCDGYYDENKIGELYSHTTKSSSYDAIQRAKQDELDIQNYMKSTRKYCRRLSC